MEMGKEHPAENTTADAEIEKRRELSSRIDTVGWGLLFIWVGIAFLLQVGWPTGLIGVGILFVGEQAIRLFYRAEVEWFWGLVGLAFIAGGIWHLAESDVPFIPVLLILAGVVLLLSVVFKKQTRV